MALGARVFNGLGLHWILDRFPRLVRTLGRDRRIASVDAQGNDPDGSEHGYSLRRDPDSSHGPLPLGDDDPKPNVKRASFFARIEPIDVQLTIFLVGTFIYAIVRGIDQTIATILLGLATAIVARATKAARNNGNGKAK